MERTVEKAFALLEALIRSGQPRRLTELGRQLGLTKPNAFRLLGTLTVLGYVKKDLITKMYTPTLKSWELASLLVSENDVPHIARRHLEWLAAASGAPVELMVLEGGRGVCVSRLERGGTAAAAGLGERQPAALTATGKALLAWKRREALDEAMPYVTRYTPLTLTRRKDIEHELKETRAKGYAIDCGEFRTGVCGIAAPVRDRTGNVVAAVGLSGASEAILGRRQDALAGMLLKAAQRISDDLMQPRRPQADSGDIVTGRVSEQKLATAEAKPVAPIHGVPATPRFAPKTASH